mgnify:CR=1 FL=1
MNLTLLKNRSHPPGGWTYWCPKGEMDFPGGFAFDQQVSKIRAYRAANPSLNLPSDIGSCRHELLLFTFARLRKRIGLENTLTWFSVTDSSDAEIDELVKKKLPNSSSEPPSEPVAKPAGVIETIKDYAAGARILSDWLGEGAVPVSPELAQRRADTCIACKFNTQPNWLEKLSATVAGVVKEQVELRNQMSLHVQDEDKLMKCSACQCVLNLKVWVPLKNIMDTISESQYKRLAKQCWIKQESKL